jgi:DNA-binding transcriptional LysR family regulator
VVLRVASFAAAAVVVAQTDLVVTLPAGFARTMARSLPLVLRPLPLPELPPFKFTVAYGAPSQNDPAHAWLRRLARDAALASRVEPAARPRKKR